MNVGDIFGRLTVLELIPGHLQPRRVRNRARVRCGCGAESIVRSSHLVSGNTLSCGCLRRELSAARLARFRVHGQTDQENKRHYTPEYIAWLNAKARVTNPRRQCWKNYGGRGIRMAAEWLHDFAAFFAHIGLRPGSGYTLDRIDNDRGYEPGNVRWATRLVQRHNRRDVTPNEEPKS